jgi:hypothetical protein
MQSKEARRSGTVSGAPLLALFFALQVNLPALADTYEFDMLNEEAESPAKKLDLSSLRSNPGQVKAIQKDAEPKWKTPEKGSLLVKTGPDSLLIQTPAYIRIYDFKNKKIVGLDPARKLFYPQSLYADLAFRAAELGNRTVLHAVVGNALKGKFGGQIFDPFFSEEMFSLQLPEKNSAYELNKTKNKEATDYKHDNLVVSSFVPAATALAGEKQKQFSRFLIYGTYLHPEIRLDIEKSAKVPQKLMYFLDNQPIDKKRVTLTLKKVTPGDYTFAIPAGFSEKHDDKDPLISVYKRIKETGSKPPANLQEQVLAEYKAALESKNYLDIFLCLTEYNLQTGEILGDEMQAVKNEIKTDPECKKLLAGLRTPKTEQQAVAALASLDSIDVSKLKKAYLIDLFRANVIVALNGFGMHELKTREPSDPTKAFVSVLEHNPYLTGVYTDLGKFLETSYQQHYAWQCYDLARKFYPKHPFMADITAREQQLTELMPQFISGDQIQ